MSIEEWEEAGKRLNLKKKIQKEAEKEAKKGTLDPFEAYKLLKQREHDQEDVEMKPLKELQKVANKYFRTGKDFREKTIKKTGTVYICTNGGSRPDDTYECHKDYLPGKRDQAVFKFITVSKVIVKLHSYSPAKGLHLIDSDVIIETVKSNKKQKSIKQ